MEQYEMYFASIKNELFETEGWVVIDVTKLPHPLENYLRAGRIRKVDKILDSTSETEIKKDIVRLDFLDWLIENNFITDDQLEIWEKYITDRVKK